MSGQLRCFEICLPTIKEFIFKDLSCDIFGYIANQDISSLIQDINFTQLIIEDQSFLSEYDYSGEHVKTVQGTLQQLHGLARVDMLRCAHEAARGQEYDWVIRLRPDLIFKTPIDEFKNCDNDAIYVPSTTHDYSGYNDRFAFGNSVNMKVYMQRYYTLGIATGMYRDIFHPESTLKIALDQAGIPVKRSPIKYAFCRRDGTREAELL